MALDEFAHFFTEAKLSSKQRNKLDDSQFGIPELRKYPLTDEKHVLQAVRFFNKAEEKYKPGLARRIVKRAKELDMEWENWDVLKPYLSKGKHIKEYAESLSDTPEAVKCLEELNKANVKYDKATPNTWKLKSPESVIRNKKGNCHDISYYVYKNLDKFAKKKVGKGILFVMEYKEGSEKGGVTHSVCYEKIKGGVCFIEYSWEDLRGTFPRNNIREEIDVIKHNWKFSKGFDKLFFAEIKNVDKLHPGITLDQYVKVATSNKEIISEAYAYDAITGEKIDLGPSTMTEEELRSRMVHGNGDDFTSGTSLTRDNEYNEPDDCYCESGKPWYNDKGSRVPDKCVVCDAPVKVYLRGEPVYLCSNKKCGKYYGTVPCNVNESGDINGLVNANMIASKIHDKYESDKKEPIGNQNCQLCTWCAEAQFRGKDVLPRPIYSPRDPALEIKGDDIVINPERISIKSGFDDFLFKITETPYSRWYCHVKWKDGNGGHEFLLLNIDGKPYLMDPQQGIVDKLLETHQYIKDTDWGNSYICRLDDKEFNEKLFNEYNDPSKIVPWDAKLDIPYMVKEGLLSPEEAEEYFKKYPDEKPNSVSESKNIFTSGDFDKYGKDVDLTDARGPIQESADSLALFKQLPKDLQEFLENGDFSMLRRDDDFFYVVAGYWVEEFYKPSELELCGEMYSLEEDDPYYNAIIFSNENSNSFGFNPKDGSYYYFYHDEYTVKNGKEYIEPYKLKQKTWNEIIKDTPKERVYYRFEYEGEGIYDAYKQHVSWLQWHEFKRTYAAYWLNTIPNYQSGEKSYFTEEGYEMFMKYTYPEMIKVLDKSKIKEIRVNLKPEDIRYEDKYQVTTKAGTPEPKPIQESDEVPNLPAGISMRPATEEDLPNIIQWKLESVSKKIKDDPKVIAYIKKDAKDNLRDTLMILSASENGDRVIGVLEGALIDNNEWLYIGEIYLIPEFRGRGIAKAVLQLWMHGAPKVKLRVAKENTHAIELYKSLGFTISEEDDNSYIMIIDKTKPIQEGAWNDIKRGVNPYSKKTWFHVSLSPLHEGKVFKPRVPEYLELTKQGKDDPYYEDMEIPRVCFSPSIEGAIHAITAGFKRIETAGKELYVYIPEKPIDQYKHMTNKEIVDKKLVFDAKYTKECWILEPVKLFLYGTIVIDQVSNHKAKPTANNKGETANVSYKWHWQTKPRVIKGMGHEYFYEPDEDEKKSKKSKSIKEAYNMSDFERDPSVFRMFMESDDDTDKDDDKKEDTDKKSSSDKNDDEEGDAIVSVSTTEVTTTTDDVDDFGTDAGDGEQNQYDPKEVEYLNKLIASEADAISEYFEYGKLTRVPVLSKLYTDIGDEERFHLEQLIYAKSTLTGEKYEPKDSKVRREYEELLELGMDEETAMTTAIDKTHLMPEEEEFTEEEIEEMALVSQMSEMMSFHTEIVLESMIDKSDIRSSLYEANQAFMEQAFFMEEVSNLATKQGQKQLGSKNPISAIWGLFKSIYRVIINLIKKAKLAFQKRRLKNKKKWAWIKKHGITALFKNGVSLFFWNDQTNKYEVSDALAYLKMFWDTCSMICEKANIKENVPEEKFEIKQMIDLLSKDVEFKQMRIKSLGDAIQKINGTSLSKSKMLVNDNNQNELAELFFGYTNEKYELMEREGENSKNIDISKNIYNKMNILLDAFAKCSEYIGVVIERLAELEGKPNTIYQNNPKLYNECVAAAGAVTKGLNRFNSAISYDLSEIMKIDNGLNELVSKADESGDKTELNEFKDKQAEAAAEAKKNEQEAKNAGRHGYSVQ